MPLSGKWALVCGSSQGIGKAVAQALSAQNANLVLLARNSEKLEALAKTVGANSHVQWVAADLSNHADLKTKIEHLLKDTGPIEILINNAGGPKGGPVFDAAPDEFANGLSVHVMAAQILTQLLVPGMKEKNYGRILNIISTSVKQPIPGLGVSNTIRGAMASWAKTLAGELGAFGITVNNVLPGYTNTERLQQLIEGAASRTGQSTDDIVKQWKAKVPAGRFAEPAEVAAGAAFLASPQAGYINGINLPIDGGRTQSL